MPVTRHSLYPKFVIVVDVEDPRTLQQIRNAIEPAIDVFKAEVRRLAANDPRTTIVRWHIHRAAGPVDELEP